MLARWRAGAAWAARVPSTSTARAVVSQASTRLMRLPQEVAPHEVGAHADEDQGEDVDAHAERQPVLGVDVDAAHLLVGGRAGAEGRGGAGGVVAARRGQLARTVGRLVVHRQVLSGSAIAARPGTPCGAGPHAMTSYTPIIGTRPQRG